MFYIAVYLQMREEEAWIVGGQSRAVITCGDGRYGKVFVRCVGDINVSTLSTVIERDRYVTLIAEHRTRLTPGSESPSFKNHASGAIYLPYHPPISINVSRYIQHTTRQLESCQLLRRQTYVLCAVSATTADCACRPCDNQHTS